ncbi:putative ATP-dependent RNA helicase TDRD12 [Carlito syrichta]|uniref:Putative ATP-dependent RNA helicase TDRD12 n=1 Tax=Carlito syrichta TaxID=1868482 RepID=A0A3Q0DXI9_CARSF|nr:putative ATP-dependent RNA helicase TDRD12 [Carlito syrichta]
MVLLLNYALFCLLKNLQIEDPGCFWVIIKGCSPFLDHEVDYQKLNSAMNDFYNSMCQDIEIKPLMLEEGQVCVVYCEELKCWCRAVVKSIMSSADYYLAKCFLVDLAKCVPVKSKNIRVAVESFMHLPYRAKKFRLYCTKPVTLHIDFCEDSAEIVPARKWDSAAIQYFQNILKVTTQVEAKLCAVEEDTFEVYLYVTIKNEKVCVNDELVAKNFACYMSPTESKLVNSRLNIKSASFSSKLNPALTLWPKFLQGKNFHGTENKSVKCNMDSLKDSPQNKSEKKQHYISLKDVNKCVESSAYWPTKRGITIYADPDTPATSALRQKTNEKPLRLAEKKEYDEKNDCLKLLQFLNPDPLRGDGISDLQQLQKLKLGMLQPVAVLRNRIEPCLTMDTSPLSADLRRALQRNKFPGPSHTESYSWPPIARGCDVVVISHCGNDPLVYLPPVLTILQTGGCYKSLPSRNGPLAIIVCPGWKKAQFIFELLADYGMSSKPLHPVLLTIGLHKDEAKNTKLPRGCDVIVTTPHSLLRLLTHQSLLFLRLCHLILDEVEVLFLEANEQMLAILDNFKKNTEVEERESAPHQVVAVGVHWTKHIEQLIKEFMNDPYIVITAMEEAALYGNVQQVVHLCLECEKTSTLLQALDCTPRQAQKTLIFTCSVAETDIVCKGSPAEQGAKKTKSVLLLTEKNASHAVGVLRYLERAEAKVPAELYEFTSGVLEAREDKKARRPLCPYLKAFGFCKDQKICSDRHLINPKMDMPRKLSNQALSTCGYIKIIPFYILNATNYFGRIIDNNVDLYATLNDEMNEYFKDSSNKTAVKKVEKFGLYGLAEKTCFHRVQVLEMSPKEDPWALDAVLVKFIDEGRTELITGDRLLHLPEHFHTLPPQAVEFIVCRVKPADNEMEWNPKVTRYIHHKIIGKLHDAKVILTLGNTVWIDPMVHITSLSNLKTSVIDYNVRAEILSMGMGIDNSEHVEKLKKLYKEAKMPAVEENLSQTPTPPPAEDTACLQSTQQEDGGTERDTEPETNSENQKPEHTSTPRQDFSRKREVWLLALCVHGHSGAVPRFFTETLSENTGDASTSKTAQPHLKRYVCPLPGSLCPLTGDEALVSVHVFFFPCSFHPQVKWFQKDDVVILKIKIRNVKDYKCKYFKDRVIFSAWVGDRLYMADMELQASITKAGCKCEIANDEPVVTLAKEKREPWRRLLRQKNPNVAFDFDHWEDCDEDSHFSRVINPKNLPCKVAKVVENSSSASEDDESDSD